MPYSSSQAAKAIAQKLPTYGQVKAPPVETVPGLGIPSVFRNDGNLPREWTENVNSEIRNMVQMSGTVPPIQLNQRGLPSSWAGTYQSQKLGPWGEPLPKGAQGWTPLGEADWGPGFWGQIARMHYNFWTPRGGRTEQGIPGVEAGAPLTEQVSDYWAAALQGLSEGVTGLHNQALGNQTAYMAQSPESRKPLDFVTQQLGIIRDAALLVAGTGLKSLVTVGVWQSQGTQL